MFHKRPHKKNRNGCQSCRQRRVKCDEGGPPCGVCRVRSTPCSYDREQSIAVTRGSSNTSMAEHFPTMQHRHRTELRLFHHFTTQTYKSIASMALGITEDQEMWQETIPKLALEHEFLLHAIFALASFHIASDDVDNHRHYITLGLEYQDLALKGCRAVLGTNAPHVEDAVFFFSCLLMVLALCSSRFMMVDDNNSMLSNTIMHIELLRGMTSMLPSAADNPDFFKAIELAEVQIDQSGSSVDNLTESLLRRIAAAKGSEYLSGLEEEDGPCDTQPFQQNFGIALHWLGRFLAESGDLLHSAVALGWPALAGRDFVIALQERDQTALLVLVMWAVSLRELGKQVWWAKDFGNSLVKELSVIMTGINDQLVIDVLGWAHNRLVESGI